jgi:hypothetical protein
MARNVPDLALMLDAMAALTVSRSRCKVRGLLGALGSARTLGCAASIQKSRGFVEPVPSGSQKWTAW